MKNNRFLYLAGALAIAGLIYSLNMFDKAFPIVKVSIGADKTEIRAKADSLAEAAGIMPEGYRSVTAFNTDEQFKNYVELEGGGVDIFQDIIDRGIYHPYSWSVRQFIPGEVREAWYNFTPSGKLLGFVLTLPDSLPGADIPDFDAAALYLRSDARAALLPDLEGYELVEKSSELRESGRRDHVFTFENREHGVAEAKYRIKIGVSGDEITMVQRTARVPEAFIKRYEEMRSSNTTISFAGLALMILIYGVFGVAVGLFFMIRRRTLCWKPALHWSGIIGGLIFIAMLSSVSLAWMNYDTSLSTGQFVFQQILQALANGLLIAVLFFLSAMAAEGLDRQAFPEHIRFWKMWSPTIGASKELMRQTLFAYFWAIFMVGFVTFFYWLTNRVFQWWSPAENLVDPNILALPLPWLLPAAQSLQAGFWEECLFRAVPLAGALLIGKNFRKKGLWITLALVLQAAVFGSLHANYPQQPAYARIVEMLIPFAIYGLIYIKWGLLPVVISHFVYDIILMSLPLFLLSSPGIFLHRLIAVLAALIPLLVVVYRRLRAGKWYEIQPEDLNGVYLTAKSVDDHREQLPAEETEGEPGKTAASFPLLIAILLFAAGVLGWYFLQPQENDVPRLNIKRAEAEQIAEAFLVDNIALPDSLILRPYIRLEKGDVTAMRFVDEKAGREKFRELYEEGLPSNYYVVVFKTFEGEVSARSEQVEVLVGRNGTVLGWHHQVPENREGKNLQESEALMLAESAVAKYFGLDPEQLERVQTSPEKLPDRTDWVFIYRDPQSGLEEGELRYTVRIAGDKISGAESSVHISESWEREMKKKGTRQSILQILGILVRFAFIVTMLVISIIGWTKKQFRLKVFVAIGLGLFVFVLLKDLLLSSSVFSQLPTSEPYGNLLLIFIVGLILGAGFSAVLYAIPAGHIAHLRLPTDRNEPAFWFKGLALGVLTAAVLSLNKLPFISPGPRLSVPAHLDSLSPFFSALGTGVTNYLMFLVRMLIPFVLILKLGIRRTGQKILPLLILFVSGFAYTVKCDPLWWLLSGTVFGLLMLLLYVWVLRGNLLYIPLISATVIILDAISVLLIDPGVLSLPLAVTEMAVTLLLCILLTGLMSKLQLTKRH